MVCLSLISVRVILARAVYLIFWLPDGLNSYIKLGDRLLKNFLLILLFILVSAVSALFFAQNDSIVEIKYFGGAIQWQMNWVLVSVLVIGFILGAFSVLVSLLRTKIKLANANRRLVMHAKEIKNLRALPIKDAY